MSLCIGNIGWAVTGGTIAGIVLFIILPIIICVVVVCYKARASSRYQSTTAATTIQPAIQPASTTESVVTTSSQQDGFQAYPSSRSAAQPQVAYHPPSYPYPSQAPANELTTYPNQNVYV